MTRNRPRTWTEKRRDKLQAGGPRPKRVKWHVKHWAIILAGFSLAGWLLKESASALENAEDLPRKLISVKNKVLAWHYDDAAWSKWWSTSIEGTVDSADIDVTNYVAHINISVTNGNVTGEFGSTAVCKINPMLAPLMFDGEVRFGKIHATAYQFVGGHRVNVASFLAERNGDHLTLRPVEDPYSIFGKEVKLIPAFSPEQHNFNVDNCDAERTKFIADHVSRLRGKSNSKGRVAITPEQ